MSDSLWSSFRDSRPQWLPLDAPIRGRREFRAWDLLLSVVRQFEVASCPRYRPTPAGETWCNVFVWDVTRALDAEIPHWVTEDDLPAQPGHGHHELTADGIQTWLDSEVGRSARWERTDEDGARAATSGGSPVVAGWRNGHTHGHVAVVLPSSPDSPLLVAHAGVSPAFCVPLAQAFGPRPVTFWRHP